MPRLRRPPGSALIGALALACFAKLYGIVFLGKPRAGARRGQAAAWRSGLVAPQIVLAAACVAIGVLPAVVVPVAARAARGGA